MTISISGLALVNTSKNSGITLSPLGNLTVSDTASQNVTLTVTQQNFLHTDPGKADDQSVLIGSGVFSGPFYNFLSNSTNPVTFNADGSVVVSGSLSAPTSYTPSMFTSGPPPLYTPITTNPAYSPVAELQQVTFVPPAAGLRNNQVIETKLTVTATDDAGGSASLGQSLVFTNPISESLYSPSPTVAYGSTSSPFSLSVSSGPYGYSGIVTVSVTAANFLHTDLGAADDTVTAIAPGNWGSFAPTGGASTNTPTVDNSSGTITATGDLGASSTGTYNPLTGTYTAHNYSPVSEISQTPYTPPAVGLTANQAIETRFTATASDASGDTSVQTTSTNFTNPTALSVSAYDPAANKAKLPTSPISPFFVGNNYFNVGLTATATVTQHNVLHSDYGAADDQVTVVGPGTFALGSLDAKATNFSFNGTTGTVTVTGALNAPQNYDTTTNQFLPGAYSPVSVIGNMTYATPSVTLTGNAVLETAFTIALTDTAGDSSTTTTSNFFFAPTPTSSTTPPQIAGSPPQAQSVAAGGTVLPFASVTVTDPNASASDSATITVINGGTITGLGVSQGGTPGTYTLAATSAAALTSAIDNLTFTPPNPGSAASVTSTIKLDVTNSVGTQSVSTQVIATPTPTGTSPGASTPITSANTSAVYRFFDKVDGTHFFTASSSERDTILSSRPDMVEETNGFGAVTSSTPNAVAVYRFFDTIHGTHFFTSSASERDTVQATRSDLTYEPSATFYELSANAGSDVAVYRLFDSKLGTHFYTGDAQEYAGITTPGGASYRADLKPEGVSFYAPAGSYT